MINFPQYKFIFLIVLTLFLTFLNIRISFSQEELFIDPGGKMLDQKNGFRGIKFGTQLKDFPISIKSDIERYFQFTDVEIRRKLINKHKIGERCYSTYDGSESLKDYIFFGSTVEEIEYCFYKGEFYKANINIDNWDRSYTAHLEILKTGRPTANDPPEKHRSPYRAASNFCETFDKKLQKITKLPTGWALCKINGNYTYATVDVSWQQDKNGNMAIKSKFTISSKYYESLIKKDKILDF